MSLLRHYLCKPLQPTDNKGVFQSRAAIHRKHGRPNKFCRYNNTFIINTRKHKYTISHEGKLAERKAIRRNDNFLSDKEIKRNGTNARQHRKSGLEN